MLELDSALTRSLAAIAGVSLQALVFRRGQWDLDSPRIIFAFAAVPIFGAGYIAYFVQTLPYWVAFRAVVSLMAWHLAGLFSSMLLYRAFFHRLNEFPGPFLARLSTFYTTSLSAKRLHLYEEVQKLHIQYGDYVRLGPTEISIIDPQAIPVLHSGQSTCGKGPFYTALHPRVSLLTEYDKSEHSRRRKVWDRGFNTKALRDYEPRVLSYTSKLVSHIDATAGEPVNVTNWFNFFSFDLIGDLAFGRSFGMLDDGVKHFFLIALHKTMLSIGLFFRLMWLFPIIKATPGLNYEYYHFWSWVSVRVSERMKMKLDRPDILSWILEDYETRPKTKQALINLEADAHLIAIAGSDTTSATLGCLFFSLANHPEQMTKLQEELDEFYRSTDIVDGQALSKLKHLDAVITESLRLHPAVPSGVQKLTPPEGIQIGETFIPGSTMVQIPHHTLFRDPRNFERPDEFIPERWTTQPELVKNASAYMPFSLGPYSCVGKQLALMELRYVVASLVRRYNVSLAPGQTSQAFLDGKMDTFTLTLCPLNMVFTHRKA